MWFNDYHIKGLKCKYWDVFYGCEHLLIQLAEVTHLLSNVCSKYSAGQCWHEPDIGHDLPDRTWLDICSRSWWVLLWGRGVQGLKVPWELRPRRIFLDQPIALEEHWVPEISFCALLLTVVLLSLRKKAWSQRWHIWVGAKPKLLIYNVAFLFPV